MREDIQDALLSVGEVAVFAWSLLELLCTRILPLAGFLAGHLLLQFCHLLASVVIAAAGRRQPQAEYSGDVLLQADEFIEEDKDNVQVVKEDGDHHENDLESDKLEESRPLREESLKLPSFTHEEDAMPAVEPVDEVHDVHVADSAPSNEQTIDAAANEDLQDQPFDLGAKAADDVVGEEQRHVSGEGDGEGRMPSDVQRSAEGGDDDAMRNNKSSSRRRILRVLPPSLSQIKRSLMQRSRRASPQVLYNTSPASKSPSPIKKKQQQHASPRSRNLPSPPPIKSSSSYDNFMGKFRKHFLIDPA